MKTNDIFFRVRASGPGGEVVEVRYSEDELRKKIVESIAQGVNASCAIEGEGLSRPIRTNPNDVPKTLLTTG